MYNKLVSANEGLGSAVGITVDSNPNINIPSKNCTLSYKGSFFEQNGLYEWAEKFKLGTAGYRDTINMDDFFSTDAPYNAHTIMFVAEAMARVAKKHGMSSIHLGGEVRRYTPVVLDLVGRICAGQGISVHLHADKDTTPIWASSFGVFYNEIDCGANVTASHSQNYKQGFKPMDGKGMQLLDLADEIGAEIKKMAKEVAADKMDIRLAAADSSLIVKDFTYIEAYTEYLKDIIPQEAFEFIRQAQEAGMKVGVSTVGGSMHENSVPFFNNFGITIGSDGMIQYMHAEKRDDFHKVGEIDGDNHGCDPTKRVIYRNIGLKEKLLAGEIDYGFIWDPDGDRYNIVTLADAAIADKAEAIGLEVERIEGSDKCVVYFKPNQIYFLNTAMKLEMMAQSGELFKYDWVIGTTFPTSKSIGELADVFNRKYAAEFAKHGTSVRFVNTPVGFKYYGDFVGKVEDQLKAQLADVINNPVNTGKDIIFTDAIGDEINLGKNPRILMLAEESGGAVMGSANWFVSKSGKNQILSLKEKDGMQISFMNLGVMAKLFLEKQSYAQSYIDMIEKYDIQNRFYDRIDKKLFDESLTGEARKKAETIGNLAKNYMVETFKSMTSGKTTEEVRAILQALVGDSVTIPEVKRVFWAGDGTYVDFGNFWFELRASGTDAVLRFYIEGKEKDVLDAINNAFVGIAEAKLKELSGPSALNMDPVQLVAWEKKHTYQLDDGTFSLEIGRMEFEPWQLAKMEPALRKAYTEMQRIEAGEVKNPDEGRAVTHFTDRLEYPKTREFEEVEQFASDIRNGNITVNGKRIKYVVINGIGGSALGPELMHDAIGQYTNGGQIKFLFLDNTDPTGIRNVLDQCDLSETLVVTISKSGGTRETAINMKAMTEEYAKNGLEFANYAAAITMEGSKLDTIARTNRFLKVFPMAESIGGRTSETSIVGHLPAALAGVDFKAFLDGAVQMDEATRNADVMSNMAYLMAAMWYISGNGKGDKVMAMIPYSDKLILMSRYLQQLLMESLGKELDLDGKVVNQGLTVLGNKGGSDAHAYIQQLCDGRKDMFATFIEIIKDTTLPDGSQVIIDKIDDQEISMGMETNMFLQGLQQALTAKDRSSMYMHVNELNETAMGQLIALYERAVAVYAELIHINAFHQPGVEAYKKIANATRELYPEVIKANTADKSVTADEIAEQMGKPELEVVISKILRKIRGNQ